MALRQRYLGVDAGPFRLALPIETVRQILDVGGAQASAPTDPRALGVAPVSLARLLGARPREGRPAFLLFDGHSGPVLLSTCVLGRVIDAGAPRPLPRTVACRWPGLIRGVIDDAVLDTVADDLPAAPPAAPSAALAAGSAAALPDRVAAGAAPAPASLRLVLDPRVLMGLVEAAEAG